jgi:prepilin-type N-terminal cleavage/methylation domain-containing protein
MKAMLDTAEHSGTEDGFTLVETLIALMILAISAGLFVQSVALATGQIRTAARAESAELLALSLLAEHAAGSDERQDAEGVDAVSGLYWRLVQERRPRVIDEVKRTSAVLALVEIRPAENSVPLYELRAISMEAAPQ